MPALTESVILDVQQAQRQIDALERQLQALSTPVDVPVNISGEGELAQIRRELGLSDDAADRLNRELAQTDAELRQAGTQARRTGDDIEAAGRRGGTAFAGLRGSVIGLVGAFGAIQGARAFLDFAGDAIDAASDLEESTSKAQVVFGSFFDDIQAFSQTAPSALGLANAQALEFAGTFGNLFVALGLSQQAAAELSPEIVQLGSDLASFNNIEVTEALDKLRAGLVGEAEPLRALGVNLTAASTAAKAVELGLAASTTEVSEAAKVQARYALILEQTATAQGDFARTADGIANTQRTLAGEFENFRARAGEALLPFFEGLLDAAPAALEALEDLIPVVIDFVDSLADIDFGEAIAGLRRFGTTASGVISLIQGDPASATAAGFVNDFVLSVEEGVEPVQAFAAVLEQFQGFDIGVSGSLNAQQVAQVVDQLANVADLDTTGILRLLRYFQEFGPAMDLTEAELAGITTGLQNLLRPTELIPPALDEFVNGVSNVGSVTAGAAPGVRGLTNAFADFEALDFSQAAADISHVFAALPTGLEAASDALENTEGEIVEDFSVFLGNLEEELAARRVFTDNLALLRSLGLDDLAEVFEAEGITAAGALADAVANPEEAARAEDALDQFAREQAASYAGTLRDQLARELASTPVDLTIPVNVIGAVQSLVLQGLDATTATQVVGARGAGPNVGAGGQGFQQNNDITIELQSTGDTTTDAARAAQQVNAIIRVE